MKSPRKLIHQFFIENKQLGTRIALRHTKGFLILRLKLLISRNDKLSEIGSEIRRIHLSNKIDELLFSTVKYGSFAGLRLTHQSSWDPSTRGNMLLGLYEKEVVTSIVTSSYQKDYFIDIGAADGYLCLGVLAAKLFKHSYCFESTSKGQETILANAKLNNLTNQISLFGKAEENFLSNIPQSHLKNSLVLIDIEGAEFDILTSDNIEKLKGAHLIIELHHMFLHNGNLLLSSLRERVEKMFKIELLEVGPRDLSGIPEISNWSDTDRWILCSEGRPMAPIWWKLTPS